MRDELPEIKQALQERILDVCVVLLPRGRKQGQEWVAHNPHVHEEKKNPALKVALTRNRGAWRDWRNGDKGDVIKLIMFCHGTDLKAALNWARDFLGLRSMTWEERQRLKQQRESRAKREALENEQARRRKLERAGELWRHGTEALGTGSGIEAHVRDYFRARGCPLEAITTLSAESFRVSPSTEWWKGAQYRRNPQGWSEKETEGPRFPALHSAMRAKSGAITCCHVTFLDPALPRKAPVDLPKLMYGEALGSVIEVATGPEGVPFWLATQAHPLIIAEGIETAASLAGPLPECRVWAGASLAGLGHAPAGLPCVSEIHVARDNNAGNAQARSQLDQALLRLEEADKPLAVMASHVGDDFNDLMTGEDDG